MMIPGCDILNIATRVIARQTVTYYAATGRSLNAVGQEVTTYAAAVTALGSFQPVAKSLYQALGLDLQKTYFRFFVPREVIDIQRDVSNDQLVFNGQRFQCESNTPWYAIDGWVEVLCALLGPGS